MVFKENREEELTSVVQTETPLAENGYLTASEFNAYCENELYLLDRKLASYLAMPKEDKNVFPEYPERLQTLADCIESNGKFLRTLSHNGAAFLQKPPRTKTKTPSPGNETSQTGSNADPDSPDPADPTDAIAELRALFTTIARDWSAAGEAVRAAMYAPLLEAVETAYDEASRAYESLDRAKFRVLVPRAGVGRLCWELVSRGFAVEGCESTLTSILASNYFLNHASAAAPSTVYPFVHEHRNVHSAAAQTQAVSVPDVSASETPIEADFGMRTVDFPDGYGGYEEYWDAVVTCFAFDLGDGIVPVIRRISHVLRTGGVWVFLGPRPCAHEEDLFSVQLAVSEFVDVVKNSGFRVVNEREIGVPLAPSPASLKSRTVRSKFFVAVKVSKMK